MCFNMFFLPDEKCGQNLRFQHTSSTIPHQRNKLDSKNSRATLKISECKQTRIEFKSKTPSCRKVHYSRTNRGLHMCCTLSHGKPDRCIIFKKVVILWERKKVNLKIEYTHKKKTCLRGWHETGNMKYAHFVDALAAARQHNIFFHLIFDWKESFEKIYKFE